MRQEVKKQLLKRGSKWGWRSKR